MRKYLQYMALKILRYFSEKSNYKDRMDLTGELYLGVDIGSTTVKTVVIEPESWTLLDSIYVRHNAEQARTVLNLLRELHERYPLAQFKAAVCGSGGLAIAEALGAFFIQEVVATGLIVRRFHPEVRTAIELGGQDAKLIFFRKDNRGESVIHDMRMNGSCAGGTGAFIDQIAELLNLNPEEFNGVAADGSKLYEISGRCGVFAKTDIQPLLNQGVPASDLALSSFHAIAKQTIGGLAQGMEIQGPVIFLGGPLNFNSVLIDVFKERLGLTEKQAILPEKAEVLTACGAALSIQEMYAESKNNYSRDNLQRLENYILKPGGEGEGRGPVYFKSPEERAAFNEMYALPEFIPYRLRPEVGSQSADLKVYLGIDGGSTTSKFVLLSESGEVLDKFYSSNQGEPLRVLRAGLLQMRADYAKAGINLIILAAGSTGYGEKLFHKAFRLDYHAVETVAHTRAAVNIQPDVSFILDIGGQDMKALFVERGIPVNFVLNEACSAGCGSFLETYANAMHIKTPDIAELAFRSGSASRLGSRCTVFMNSSIITEQKNGRSVSDIFAGLCYSVVENALTKVLRLSNFDLMGPNIMVQGGTFKNDAVLRAFQQRTGKNIIRPPHPGEMGAVGISLLTAERTALEGHTESSFDWDYLENLSYENLPTADCNFCTNSCSRTVVGFSDGSRFITGNRCDKGEILEEAGKPGVKSQLKEISVRMNSVPDLMSYREKQLGRGVPTAAADSPRNQTIGIPRALEFWNSLPFWRAFFNALGYEVIVSRSSSYQLFENGLGSVSSDTICLPAKVVHGHILDLIGLKVDRIFNPILLKTLPENKNAAASWMCPVIQGYSEIVRINDEPHKKGVAYDNPAFEWPSKTVRDRQILRYAVGTLGHSRRAGKKSD